MALFNKPKNTSQEIITLAAGNEALGILPHIHEFPGLPSRVVVNGSIALDEIQKILSIEMSKKNIPVVFKKGRIEYREPFSKRYEDCIIISHKNPPESYFDFVVNSRITNGSTFVRLYRSGHSYYNYQINEYKNSKNEKDGFLVAINFLHYALDKPDLQAWEDGLYIENQYYMQVITAIKEGFGI